jgi:hypothetical protein
LSAFSSAALGSLVFIALLNYAMKAGSGYDFMKPLFENNVLCYIPAQSETATHLNENGLSGIIDYFKNDPANFIKLSTLKFLSYWGMTRPYYTAFHNWSLRLYFYPLYVFAFIGVLKYKRVQKYFVLYSMGVLIIFTLSVMLTCDDWSNRFIMPVIPLTVLMAGLGIHYVCRNLVARSQKSTPL